MEGEMSKEKFTKPRTRLRGKLLLEGFDNMSSAANLAGLAPSTLYGYTSGWKTPGRDGQKRLAKVLGISLRELRELL
jgi:hypothetical protein